MILVLAGCRSEARMYNAEGSRQCLTTKPGYSHVRVDANTPTHGLPYTFNVEHEVTTRVRPTNDRVQLIVVRFSVHPDQSRWFDWPFDVAFFTTTSAAKRFFNRWSHANTKYPGFFHAPIANVVMSVEAIGPDSPRTKSYYRFVASCLKT